MRTCALTVKKKLASNACEIRSRLPRFIAFDTDRKISAHRLIPFDRRRNYPVPGAQQEAASVRGLRSTRGQFVGLLHRGRVEIDRLDRATLRACGALAEKHFIAGADTGNRHRSSRGERDGELEIQPRAIAQ